MDAAAAKAARKEAKRKKKEAKLLKRKLEGAAEPEAGGQSRAAKKKKAKKARRRTYVKKFQFKRCTEDGGKCKFVNKVDDDGKAYRQCTACKRRPPRGRRPPQ